MKKVGLLFFALASCCAGAFAGDAYYLIKDGKFQNGVKYTPFENPKFTDTPLEEGDQYVTITHKGSHDVAFEVRLTGMEGLRIGTKSLVVEYEVDAADIYSVDNINANTCEQDSKPTIIVECLDEENSAWVNKISKEAGDDAGNARRIHLISRMDIDGKAPGCESDFQTFRRFTYPTNDNEIKTVIIAYKREVEAADNSQLKIKNLYFETEEDRFPIYGCQFRGNTPWDEFQYMEDLFDADEKISMLFQDGIKINWDKNNPENTFDTQYFLSYEGDISDGSNIYVSELNTSLLVLAPKGTDSGENEYSLWFDPIKLPAAAVEAGKIKIEAVVKKYGKDKSYKLVGNVNGINQDELLPIYVSFDEGEASPAFPDSIIYGTWTKEVGEIEVPAGAKTINVEFRQSPKVSYLVDFFLISYKGKVGVATVNGESKTLTVYPNPVSEAIEFAGIEDIQSVEVVSLNGAVKACSVVNNQVNVSDLAAGEYVIIVNKNITGKFIKE